MRSLSRGSLRFRDQRGSVTAECAIVMPALVVVLAACVSAVGAIDAAATAARSLARGGSVAEATSIASRLAPGSTLSHRETDGFVCATVSRSITVGIITLDTPDSADVCGATGGV